MKWSRLTVNLDPQLAALAKRRAAAQRRSFAAYVATLIEQDTRANQTPERPPEKRNEYPDRPADSDLLAAEDADVRDLLARAASKTPTAASVPQARPISPRPRPPKR